MMPLTHSKIMKRRSLTSLLNTNSLICRTYSVLKKEKNERRRKSMLPHKSKKRPMPTSKFFEPSPLFLNEPQIMVSDVEKDDTDADLVELLQNPYLTSRQPSSALGVLLYQQHLINVAQEKRDRVRSDYVKNAQFQGKDHPQMMQGKYNMPLEEYSRVYMQRLRNAWLKRNWIKTLKVVDEMQRMDVPLTLDHYKYIIGNMIDCGEYPRAEYFFNDMLEKDIAPTVDIYEKLLQGCLYGRDVERAQKYWATVSDAGLVLDYQAYVYLSELYFKVEMFDKVDAIFGECQEVGHVPTEDLWVLLMKSKALRGDRDAIDTLIQEADQEDVALSTPMLNQLMRTIPAREKDELMHFFETRFQENGLERDPETYEVLLEKLYEIKEYDSVKFYYNDLIEYVANHEDAKPSDKTFLIALKAARDNNLDVPATEDIWRDMKSFDVRRKYHPNWKKPVTMKESRYYYIKERLDLDAEHREIIRHVRKVAWIRKRLASLEKSEDSYQTRVARRELRQAADEGGISYGTTRGKDFIPLTKEDLEYLRRSEQV